MSAAIGRAVTPLMADLLDLARRAGVPAPLCHVADLTYRLVGILIRSARAARESVALRLVCDRESEIERFVSEEYWQISAELKTPRGEDFTARLTAHDGEKITKMSITDGDFAARIKNEVHAILRAHLIPK